MPIEVLMPALSPTMELGVLSKWLIKEGDSVKVGDIIAEVETDKAIMELESVDSGIVGKLLFPSNSRDVKVGSVIAVLLKSSEKISDISQYLQVETNNVVQPVTKSIHLPPNDSLEQSVDLNDNGSASLATKTLISGSSESSLKTRVIEKAKFSTLEDSIDFDKSSSLSNDEISVSPLARRLATRRKIDLTKVFGSGPGGRIIKRDIDLFSSGDGSCQVTTYVPGRISNDVGYTSIPLTTMRRAIANKLQESKSNIPHFYLSTAVDMDKVMQIRADVNKYMEEKFCDHSKISVNDIIIKSVGMSLENHPEMNRCFGNGEILESKTIDVSVAISVNAGLFAPKICDVNLKPLTHIAKETKDLIQRARTGKLSHEELTGGSITVSNLGMFGVEEFYAILNPPQASIVAVGSINKIPVCDDSDSIRIGNVMKISMSVDHRVVDGIDAAMFLETLKEILLNPVCVFLGQ